MIGLLRSDMVIVNGVSVVLVVVGGRVVTVVVLVVVDVVVLAVVALKFWRKKNVEFKIDI